MGINMYIDEYLNLCILMYLALYVKIISNIRGAM